MPKIIFDLDAIQPLALHARSCAEHSATYEMLSEPAYWKPGATPDVHGNAPSTMIDHAKIPPHLVLVKDRGVYLMSSGLPRLLDPADPTGTRSLAVYAKGLGPDTPPEAWSAFGGDDFVERVDLDVVKRAFASGARELKVDLTPATIAFEFEAAEPAAYNGAVVREINALAGCTVRAKRAEPGKAYIGFVYGYDTHVVMQKVGRGLIIHDKSALAEIPSKGRKIRIAYPEFSRDKAEVADYVRSRSRRQEPAEPAL